MVLDGTGGSNLVLSVDITLTSVLISLISLSTQSQEGVVGRRDVHSILALMIWLREGLILEPGLCGHHDTAPTSNHPDSRL